MKHLETYLNKIIKRGNPGLADAILKTAEDVGEKNIRNFSFNSHEIGLLFGNVQSGKTGHMFGIMCKAADLGFPAFVLLTTDNIVLQQQTLDRVKEDLEGFCICGENDSGLFIQNSLQKPVIIVLKKNSRMLRLWANVLSSTGFMKGNPLFVIDDEADAASLNTLVNRNKQSSINKHLDSIKNNASSSIYLQVTGTPQAIFLQTQVSGWHPMFTYYFRPGNAYLGGDFFFPQGQKPDCIHILKERGEDIKSMVIRHLAVSGIIMAAGGAASNCLLHPSVRQNVHSSYAKKIHDELKWCKQNSSEFSNALEAEYNAIQPAKYNKRPFSDVLTAVNNALAADEIKVLVMNGTNTISSDQYSYGINFVVGGNTLGRGVTFPTLQTIYYTRTSKKPQADTMWQHSRMFGYDRDPGMMMVYIDEVLYKLFSDINATNNSLISQVESEIKNVKIIYPEGLAPTRKNVIDSKRVGILTGGTNYYPHNPDNNTIEQISELLKPFEDTEPYYQINLRLMIEILNHIESDSDFKPSMFISIIKSMLASVPAAQGILIVRRERNVAKGTGALLSPNDWTLGTQFPGMPVLTMYQMTGEKGWGGKRIWVPNIKLPSNNVYYNLEFEEESDTDD